MTTATRITLDELCVDPPAPGPADWNDDGVVILEGFMPDDLLTMYEGEWAASNGYHDAIETYGADPALLIADRPGGWPDCTPYMRHPALRRLLCDGPLGAFLERLVGDAMGVHLNLTGWVTTERDWHADQYLNEPEVGDHYAAVWIALGDIHPDSGPFQYVPGSHRWPQVTRERILAALDPSELGPQWPKHSERILSPLFAEEIERRGAEIVTHLPKRGDCLLWHGRLLHRGSRANVPGAYRPALIAHYSGVHHRSQMPSAIQHEAGGWYFPIEESGPVS